MIRTAALFPPLLLVVLSACVSPQPKQNPNNVQVDPLPAQAPIDLKLSGCGSLGEGLVPALLEAFITSRGGQPMPWIDEKPGERRLTVRGAADIAMPRHVSLSLHDSTSAFQALKDGRADIGMSSRVISARELMTLASVGDFKNGRSEHVIAFDGLAVIVNAANPVKELSVEQVTKVFSCRTTDWNQGKGSPAISLYASEDGEEIQELFEVLDMPFPGMPQCANARKISSSSERSQAVTADPNGIAIVSLPYILKAHAVSIRECGGVASPPTIFTVRSREYPLSRPLYLYTPAQPGSPFVHQLVDFALSQEGQEIVHQEKFAGLAVRPDLIDPQDRRLKEATLSVQNADRLGNLIELTLNASRLAVTFHFKSQDIFDEFGRGDLDRLAQFMASPAAQGKELMLLGFADDSGSYQDSLERSRSRARTVARALQDRGVTASVVEGFSEEAPVACNSSESGRARNRRVEVWIR